jgi:hypothetical protein
MNPAPKGRALLLPLLAVAVLFTAACRIEEHSAPAASSSTAAAGGQVSSPGAAVRVIRIIPEGTRAGKLFNVQSNGLSAISVLTENATHRSVIVMGGQRLATTFGHPGLLTAYVPPSAFAAPGAVEVVVVDGDVASNAAIFQVVE